ncbi:hypothetical protein BDP27DRAFT_724716 [Rhodocollybia butyracea]|uniref:Uncharacterized protein n=1 Tax=Rhodocollybia butyracea TaxID=206335 RepID=A0A9P5P5U2_9AGAR|nr:hypothetical protein BDP27DRAFT_724716 [Rhodocollybia butyracea]
MVRRKKPGNGDKLEADDSWEVNLIDFEFSGRQGATSYPAQLNDGIQWAEGVQPAHFIQPVHDNDMLRLVTGPAGVPGAMIESWVFRDKDRS